jgi:hypothetical protein
VESFDFGRFPGYCDNCQDEIASNYWYDEDEDGWDFEDDNRWRSEEAFLWP